MDFPDQINEDENSENESDIQTATIDYDDSMVYKSKEKILNLNDYLDQKKPEKRQNQTERETALVFLQDIKTELTLLQNDLEKITPEESNEKLMKLENEFNHLAAQPIYVEADLHTIRKQLERLRDQIPPLPTPDSSTINSKKDETTSISSVGISSNSFFNNISLVLKSANLEDKVAQEQNKLEENHQDVTENPANKVNTPKSKTSEEDHQDTTANPIKPQKNCCCVM